MEYHCAPPSYEEIAEDLRRLIAQTNNEAAMATYENALRLIKEFKCAE